MARRRIRTRWAAIAVAALVHSACGGTTITRSTSAVTSTDDYGADIPVRLTAAAVKPSTLHLFNGVQATFVNEDSAVRSLVVDTARSDQAGCAALTISLQPGERKTTDVLPRFAACYFRDAQRPADTAFQGVVVTH
ncbi:MAG TPA: hypothetical protein VFK70_06130 [Vicinamibacteria bacterium]|nr:hypothetical protein [Vicinamibacteria bacterium]